MRKLTRRAFVGTGLLASGALVIGVSIQPGNRSEKVAGLIADADDHVFDIWIKISPDNTVTIIVPHAEMGQGVHTTLAMMLADELDADWDKVIISEAPAQEAYANHMLLKGFVAGDISTVMSPRTVLHWAENAEIFKDTGYAFRVTFLNKCDDIEKNTIAEYYQRCFGDELPESMINIQI